MLAMRISSAAMDQAEADFLGVHDFPEGPSAENPTSINPLERLNHPC
jgi:hypothetical protein